MYGYAPFIYICTRVWWRSKTAGDGAGNGNLKVDSMLGSMVNYDDSACLQSGIKDA